MQSTEVRTAQTSTLCRRTKTQRSRNSRSSSAHTNHRFQHCLPFTYYIQIPLCSVFFSGLHSERQSAYSQHQVHHLEHKHHMKRIFSVLSASTRTQTSPQVCIFSDTCPFRSQDPTQSLQVHSTFQDAYACHPSQHRGKRICTP